MGSVALALAWLGSLAPLLLERAGWLDLAGTEALATPRLALSFLPWIALAGLPRAGPATRDPHGWWASSLASAPVLAAALALDVAGGAAWARVAVVAPCMFACVALSAIAADLARSAQRASRIHAVLWTAVVLGLPLLAAALSWGARPAGSLAPQWTRSAALSSPLQWALAAVDGSPSPFAALAFLIGLCAIAALTSRTGKT